MAYNMYENGTKSQGGYASESRFFEDVLAKYREYKETAKDIAYFVPSVIPGYNDRGVRPGEDHYVIPRTWAPGAETGSMLKRMLTDVAIETIDERLNMILITSWNEWNEDTAIEPVFDSGTTSNDISETGFYFTQGYPYEGYEFKCVAAVKEATVAVSGQLTGARAKGVAIEAYNEGRLVSSTHPDSKGYYRFSRLNVPAARYVIKVAGTQLSEEVTVNTTTTVDRVDFRMD